MSSPTPAERTSRRASRPRSWPRRRSTAGCAHEIAVLEVDEAFGPGLAQAPRPAQRAAHQRAGRPAQPLLRARPRRRRCWSPSPASRPATSSSTPTTTTSSTSPQRLAGTRCRAQRVRAWPPSCWRESAWLARGDNPALADAVRDPDRRTHPAGRSVRTSRGDDRGRRASRGRRHPPGPRASQRRGCDGGLRDGARAARRAVRSRGRGSRPRGHASRLRPRRDPAHPAAAKSSRSS